MTAEQTREELPHEANTEIEPGETLGGATFEMPADDPRRTENRGGLEATLGVEGGMNEEHNALEDKVSANASGDAGGTRPRHDDDNGTGGNVMSGDNTVGTLMTGNTG